jgi:galactokinase
MSSSAAIETAFGVLWEKLGGWGLDRMTLARLCQQAENRYVGVNCGLMDQFACANGVEGSAVFLDTRSLQWYPVPLPPKTVIVVADSGVRRSLATSAYNERRAACEQAVAILQAYLPGIRALRDVSTAQFTQYSDHLPELVARRAQHVVEECARVQEALECLRRSDADGFGRLMIATHASLRDLYEVSCPELDVLVEIARDLPGCWGARLTGAGFGGCTVNLVEENQAEAFIRSLKAGYLQQTGRSAEVYLCRAVPGAHMEEGSA